MTKKEKNNWNMVYLFVGYLAIIFAPTEVYLLSIDDLWFSIYDFATYLLLLFGVYIAVWILYERLISSRLGKIDIALSTIILYVGIALYVQGNIIKSNYGELDGKEIEWSKYTLEGIVSILVFAIAVIVAIAVMIICRGSKMSKLKRVNNILSVALILLMTYTLATLMVMNDGLQNKNKYISISKGRWDYSSEENYIILLLDNFDSRLFDDLLAGEEQDEVEQIFEDFIYFEDAKGFYEYTKYAVPQILTGERFLNQQEYADYLDGAYENSSFLDSLQEQKYRLKIHTTADIPQNEFNQKVENWQYTKTDVDSHRKLLTYIYKLCGFRYLPQQLKKYCWFYTDDMDELKIVSYVSDEPISPEDGYYEWANWYLHDNMKMLNTSINEPVFHFTHIKGCHDIRDVGPDFRLIDTNVEGVVSRYDSAYMSVKLVGEYLDELREEGIYDKSVIIIMADHGQVRYDEGISQPYAQSPLLVAKGRNEKHNFSKTDLRVSYDDLQTFFINLLNGDNAIKAMGEIPTDRIRYTYLSDVFTPASKKHEHPICEYAVYGNAKDDNSIIETGKVYK